MFHERPRVPDLEDAGRSRVRLAVLSRGNGRLADLWRLFGHVATLTYGDRSWGFQRSPPASETPRPVRPD